MDHNIFGFTFSKPIVITEEAEQKIRNLYENKEKIAYLTFDDGPTEKVTPNILDILDKLQVKANFFVVGKHVKEHPELIQRQYNSGHFIANHGYSHNNAKLYQSKKAFLKEIQNTDKEIAKALGLSHYSCHLFRFPNGFQTNLYTAEKQNCVTYLKQIDYTYIDWNVVNNDSVQKASPSQLLNNLKKGCHNKGTIVVLMHDTGDVNNTYDILEDSILFLKEQGYVFQTFHELLEI